MPGTWRISAASYYADWVTIPIIGLTAAVTDVSYHGLTWVSWVAFVLGMIAMSFVEYASHRWAFHNPRLYRREHWVHHVRPADYIGIPGWQTAATFAFLLAALWLTIGIHAGSAFFVGVCTYYLAYIISHDRIHHGGNIGVKPGYWQRRRKAHDLHHAKGVEANFGVASPLWDMLLGTYIAP